MFPTQIRRADHFAQYPHYKSPYGLKYGSQPHILGLGRKQIMSLGKTTAGLGGVALFAVIFYASGIPKVKQDILQKVPFVGSYFIDETPPEDMPF